MRIASALLAGASLAVSVAGCGLTTSESPEAISRENLPPDLGGPPEAAQPEVYDAEGVNVSLYFVNDTDDGEVLVDVKDSLVADSPQVLLETLFTFKQQRLDDDGYHSSIPNSVRGGDAKVELADDGELAVDLPAAFYDDAAPGEGRYAVGQVVMTVTTLLDVERVRFLEDGEDRPVPDSNGITTEDPVERADYQDLLAG